MALLDSSFAAQSKSEGQLDREEEGHKNKIIMILEFVRIEYRHADSYTV